MSLISVKEATQIITDTVLDFGTTTVALEEASGRILAEELVADRDFPPFHRVAMDGIAFRYADFAAGQKEFPVYAIVAAGSPPPHSIPARSCVEIMTGAVLPDSCDTVVRYEDLIIKKGIANLQLDTLNQGQNIHRQASDRQKGDTLVPKGQRLGAPEIGIAATIGKTWLRVKKHPAIALISTGDELVDIQETPLAYQIRSSNTRQMAALLHQEGYSAAIFHLPDDPEVMKEKLRELLTAHPLLILSGGVSKGKFDFLPQVLTELNVHKKLHRIAQRPGKPLWMGTHERGVVFGLPGNPVSSFVGMRRYVLPWLTQSLGMPPPLIRHARLSEAFQFKPALTYFLPVQLQLDADGQVWAVPQEQGGSGNLAKLSLANAFLELPADQDVFRAGEIYPCWPYR